jgi:hypothetical protein
MTVVIILLSTRSDEYSHETGILHTTCVVYFSAMYKIVPDIKDVKMNLMDKVPNLLDKM